MIKMELHKDCKKLMIDLDLDRPGSVEVLAREISTEENPVNRNSLNMALTGYRQGPRYQEILKRLHSYLNNIV